MISISLVLFLLGIFGLIVINAQSYAEHLKRELKIEAYFKDVEDPKLKDKELDLQKSYIDSLKVKYPFVEATQYISKEDAAKIAKKIWVRMVVISSKKVFSLHQFKSH